MKGCVQVGVHRKSLLSRRPACAAYLAHLNTCVHACVCGVQVHADHSGYSTPSSIAHCMECPIPRLQRSCMIVSVAAARDTHCLALPNGGRGLHGRVRVRGWQ